MFNTKSESVRGPQDSSYCPRNQSGRFCRMESIDSYYRSLNAKHGTFPGGMSM